MAVGGIRRASALVVMASAVLWTSTATASPSLTVSGLKTNGLSEPLGIGDGTPDFSWKLAGAGRAADAVGLRDPRRRLGGPARVRPVPVAVRARSRRPSSPTSCYGGQPLPSRQPAAWQVRVWDAAGEVSAWSAPADLRDRAPAAVRLGLGEVDRAGRAQQHAAAADLRARVLGRQDGQERAPVHERPRPLRGAAQRVEAHRRGARARLHELPALGRVPHLRRDRRAPRRGEHARRRARQRHGQQHQDGQPGRTSG